MFAPEGWISLRDVYQYFVWYFSENETLGPYVFTGDESYELTWTFAGDATSLSVCLPSGVVLKASRQLVETHNECYHENEHVNLHFGTIGSGSVLSANHFPDDLTLKNYLKVTYGPFRNLPIVFREEEFDAFLEGLIADEETVDGETDLVVGNSSKEDLSPRAVSERILREWEHNPLLTFAALKEKVASNLSFRAFRFAWGLAAMKQPKLSSPGRRRKP